MKKTLELLVQLDSTLVTGGTVNSGQVRPCVSIKKFINKCSMSSLKISFVVGLIDWYDLPRLGMVSNRPL